MKTKTIRSVLPAFLFALYSVLALYANNLGEVLPASIFRPLAAVILLALVLTSLFQLFLGEWAQAGLLASWSLFLFLTYGHVYNFIAGLAWAAFLAHHRVLLPIWMLFFLGGLILLFKRRMRDEKPLLIVNVVLAALLLFSLTTVVWHTVAQAVAERSYLTEQIPTPGLDAPENPPDIYYILLDGYTRADVLSTKFGYDNSDFIQTLKGSGFYIADCSRSNYQHTHLTLPSLMNMAYVDALVGEIPEGATIDSLRFDALTKDNQVMRSLKGLGYETVAFETSFYWAQFSEADYYFEPVKNGFFTPGLTAFEKIYLETTMVSALLDWNVTSDGRLFQAAVLPNQMHAQRIQFTLDKLKELPQMAGPQFILAHMVIPHPPYIFDEEGVIANLAAYDEAWEEGEIGQAGYISNIRFINREILGVVQDIIANSETPPIIILQADHGSDFYDRTMILSAFYLPGLPPDVLYPDITPVNTFRLVFRSYFGAPLEMLPDETFSGRYPPFEFELIEESYPHCLKGE